MVYHGNFSFEASWSLPIAWRTWFINRLRQERERENDPKGGNTGGDQGPPKDIRRLLESATPKKKNF